MSGLRITTWNVNGIRNPFGYPPWRESRTYNAMFDILDADVVVMQELKIQRKDLSDDMVLVPGWDCFFSLPKHKKGYSGVGIYTRQAVCCPIRAEEGLLGVLCPPDSSVSYRDQPEHTCIGGYPTPAQVTELGVDAAALDAEGRCLVIEFPAFVLLGIYAPANSNGLRDGFRHGFLLALDIRIRNLARMGKRIVVTGDLNVSRDIIDTARAEENMKREGISYEDYLSAPNRRLFNHLLEGGNVPGERDEGRAEPVLWDVCRGFYETRDAMFTHWEQKINARPGNFGSRIDYVLCSIDMKSWVSDSNIQEGLMGSDHCPVFATLKFHVDVHGEHVKLLDLMNPPGVFEEGKRLRELSNTDLPPLSGRLLPEFDKRRSIKDMFARTTSHSQKKRPRAFHEEIHATQEQDNSKAHDAYATEAKPNSRAPAKTPPSHSPPNAAEKRLVTISPAAKPPKRPKLKATASKQRSSSKGQQSLKGFFTSTVDRPESPEPPEPSQAAGDGLPCESAVQCRAQLTAYRETAQPDVSHTTETREAAPRPSQDMACAELAAAADADQLVDLDTAREEWTRLFSRKPPPRCESHTEPCISLTTKKPGVNCGRRFWICPRPLGPSGNKERGSQWRCGTFIWASDWNSNKT